MEPSTLSNLPEVSFIDHLTLEELQNQMINDFKKRYKEIKGEDIELELADPFRLILYACSLQQYQAMQYIDIQGKNNLLKYSSGNFLDQLAALRGITRNQGCKARADIKFELANEFISNISIPEGTRLSVGELFFQTTQYAEIVAGSKSIVVEAECTETGTKGNGYLPGEIHTIVDSLPYVAGAQNVTTSEHGTDVESDESLAERIYLVPSSYSVAGPSDAYIYFAKEFNPSIGDVKVTSPSPATVKVCFILNDGSIPDSTMINGLREYLSDKRRRPLTDNVVVMAPDITNYNINVEYYINDSDKNISSLIQSNVEASVESYKVWQNGKIGRDINPSKLIQQMMVSGAKRVNVISPTYATVDDNSIPHHGTVTITYKGIEDD